MGNDLWGALAQFVLRGSRSTALNPLQWLLALVLAAMLIALRESAPGGVIVLLSLFAAGAFGLICYSYYFLLHSNPDALRSEPFSLEKLRIQQGLIGDSSTGFQRVIDVRPTDSIEYARGELKNG